MKNMKKMTIGSLRKVIRSIIREGKCPVCGGPGGIDGLNSVYPCPACDADGGKASQLPPEGGDRGIVVKIIPSTKSGGRDAEVYDKKGKKIGTVTNIDRLSRDELEEKLCDIIGEYAGGYDTDEITVKDPSQPEPKSYESWSAAREKD